MLHDRDIETLIDIAEAARLVIDFKKGSDLASFRADRKTQSSIVHQMLVIGEAVKRLSPSFCASRPEIPWAAYAKMRDKMIHRYQEILTEEVWNTACADIPRLLAFVEPLLPPRNP
jgi:uncharacterized protein with HEPN domain